MIADDVKRMGWKREVMKEELKNGCEQHRVTFRKNHQDIRGHGNSEKEAEADALDKLVLHLKEHKEI